MFILTKVLSDIYQHWLTPHKKEILDCAVITNDEIIYNLLVCHDCSNYIIMLNEITAFVNLALGAQTIVQ